MITQTTLKYANVVIDDLNDFSEFSKEKEIISLSDENIETYGAKTKSNNVATSVDTISEQNVATSDD